MAIRKPLVLISGDISQLPPGDFISGDTVNAIPGSGLVGGGTDVNEFRFDVALSSAPSGLIFVNNKLGIDGSAQASGNAAQLTANNALASGNLAFSSGISAQRTANNALASGNLAIASGNAAISLGLTALSSGNAGIAQALAGVQRIIPGSGLFVVPVGGSGIVTIHSSGTGGLVTATAGSGLVGGGTDTANFRFDVALATAPSGLIFVSNKLGLDGAAQASGNAAISLGINALASGNLAIASGNAAQVTANNALASGNLAFSSGISAQSTANNALTSGNLAIASGNAAISLGLTALASGNAGIAQGLAGVRTIAGGSGMFVTPVGGSGFVTVHSSGVSPTAGSGLVGGGTNVLNYRFDVALAAAPSGLIFVSNKLGLDGAAQASGNAAQLTANNALTSGNLAIASGNAAISLGLTALSSGNAGIAQGLAGVTRLVAGTNITLSPTGGSGVVTVTAAGGGATGSGTEKIFFENQTTVSGSYTITSGFNAGSFGPITVASGVIVTIPSGSVWTVV